MPSRAEALRIGPFPDGLNTAVDQSAIADTELAECDNFEVDLDGTLVGRPAIEEADIVGTTNLQIIGRGLFPGGQSFLFASKVNNISSDDGVYVFDGNAWSLIDGSLVSSVAVQYGGFVWIVPKPGTKSTRAGGRWDPVNGFVLDSNMPEGEGAIFYKSRMFIVPGADAISNASRITFTDNITSGTLSWPASNIIDVSPGDGQNLVDLIVQNDNILLFKSDSTYVLAYDTNPSAAVIRTVNSSIGVSGRYCLATYENSIFTLHQGKVYEIINFDFEHLNIKVPFELRQLVGDELTNIFTTRHNPVFLSRLGDRLVVGYFDKVYVYGLKTRTWCTWSSPMYIIQNFGPLWEMPTHAPEADNPAHYAVSNLRNLDATFRVYDKHTISYDRYFQSSTTIAYVPFESSFKTKIFDFANSHQFKKLFWWGVDMIGSNVTTTVIPYSANAFQTWSSFSTEDWDVLDNNTPGQTDNTLAQTTTTISEGTIPSIRTFQKFAKTLRFRMLQFEVKIQNSGNVLEGPVRVFSLTAILNTKQIIAKQVN